MTRTMQAVCAAALVFGASAAAAQESSLASANKADPAMKVETADFAAMAMGSGMFEIRSSEIAKEKSKSADVKSYADAMIADHRKADKELKAALGDKLKSGAMMAPKQAAMVKLLDAAKDADFQTLYIDMQAQSHREAVALFRTYSGNGDDAKVKAFAKETLPTLTMHMEMAQKLVATH